VLKLLLPVEEDERLIIDLPDVPEDELLIIDLERL